MKDIIDELVKQKMKEYACRHKFKVETKYGNTYIFCEEHDYITHDTDKKKLIQLLELMEVEYTVQCSYLENEHFSLIISGEDKSRADYIQKFIDNGYKLKWN